LHTCVHSICTTFTLLHPFPTSSPPPSIAYFKQENMLAFCHNEANMSEKERKLAFSEVCQFGSPRNCLPSMVGWVRKSACVCGYWNCNTQPRHEVMLGSKKWRERPRTSLNCNRWTGLQPKIQIVYNIVFTNKCLHCCPERLENANGAEVFLPPWSKRDVLENRRKGREKAGLSDVQQNKNIVCAAESKSKRAQRAGNVIQS
jgi:hypothetical protein